MSGEDIADAALARKPRFVAPPFVGVDGEGVGRGDDHRYALFRMGSRELYRRDRRLRTPELLNFICRHNASDTLVAYAFDYDVSMILRDVRSQRFACPDILSPLEKVLAWDQAKRQGAANPFALRRNFLVFDTPEMTFDPDSDGLVKVTYGVRYVPGRFLEVCRGRPGRLKYEIEMVPGSLRVIYDVFSLFGGSFVAALEDYRIGSPADRRAIVAMKTAREKFTAITPAVRNYCKSECLALASLMNEVRSIWERIGPPPAKWNGPGQLARALLVQHGAIGRIEIEKTVPEQALEMAAASFYGGRIEATRAGLVRGPVTYLDLNSAFAAAMLNLPCLRHGTWRKAKAAELELILSSSKDEGAIFFCPVVFSHRKEQFLGTLPVRSKDGELSWPRNGQGVYTSPEIFSARRRGASLKLKDGWLYQKTCDCKPLDWVENIYAERDRLGTKGGIVKKALQAIYGKVSQRTGKPAFKNMIFASLITARVRAAINDMIERAGERNVILISTDAMLAVGRPPAGTSIGKRLGQWKASRFASLFVVGPGIYWQRGKRKKAIIKTSGIAKRFFIRRTRAFERAFASYARGKRNPIASPPRVKVMMKTFTGIRLALHQNKLDEICRWRQQEVMIGFDWGDKRSLEGFDGRSVILGSLAGSSALKSEAFDNSDQQMEFDRRYRAQGVDELKIIAASLPDPVDFSPLI